MMLVSAAERLAPPRGMPAHVQVAPLQCVRCGACLPLGSGRSARCPYCSAETPIPVEYERVQRAAQAFTNDRKLAAELYGKIGRPPGVLGRAMATAVARSEESAPLFLVVLWTLANIHPVLGIGAVLALAYVIGFPVAFVMKLAFQIAHHQAAGPISPMPVLAIATLVVVPLFGIPFILVRREKALAEVRAGIHASLAARMPARAGGPSLCRNCGAALDVPSGALGVPCPYCRADNLVALPGTWVAHVRSMEFQKFLAVDSALEAYRRASETAREQVFQLGFFVVLVFPLMMALAYVLDVATIHY